ncbi:uncharacterized protein LOC122246689 isoform X1 [Penaeus japonicus]|uniref:uncharacterized protein LOC122246689 isoform X1 n=1 Tax=Penaeus japonicus TaxID=27405 RepID=UPI001C711FC9|nr:uncharacterized protein LOC122246689 isoform X1 [Penaeus japonicus]
MRLVAGQKSEQGRGSVPKLLKQCRKYRSPRTPRRRTVRARVRLSVFFYLVLLSVRLPWASRPSSLASVWTLRPCSVLAPTCCAPLRCCVARDLQPQRSGRSNLNKEKKIIRRKKKAPSKKGKEGVTNLKQILCSDRRPRTVYQLTSLDPDAARTTPSPPPLPSTPPLPPSAPPPGCTGK